MGRCLWAILEVSLGGRVLQATTGNLAVVRVLLDPGDFIPSYLKRRYHLRACAGKGHEKPAA